jgi:hypothetical protein
MQRCIIVASAPPSAIAARAVVGLPASAARLTAPGSQGSTARRRGPERVLDGG